MHAMGYACSYAVCSMDGSRVTGAGRRVDAGFQEIINRLACAVLLDAKLPSDHCLVRQR